MYFSLIFSLCKFTFSLMNALVYVNIDKGHPKGKYKVAQNETNVFRSFCSVSLEHFVEQHEPLFLNSNKRIK